MCEGHKLGCSEHNSKRSRDVARLTAGGRLVNAASTAQCRAQMLLARRLAGDWLARGGGGGAKLGDPSTAAADCRLWHGSGMVGLYKHPSFVAVTNQPSVAFVFVTALRFPCFLLIYENSTSILLMTCNIRCKGNRPTNCKMME